MRPDYTQSAEELLQGLQTTADGLTETDSPFNLKTPEAPEGPSLHL